MVESGKRVLIIGNGFDLAHNLPTRYSDFLEFAYRAMCIYTYSDNSGVSFDARYISEWEICADIKRALSDSYRLRTRKIVEDNTPSCKPDYSVNDRLDKFNNYLRCNAWFHYLFGLYKRNEMRGENWIDFESEISCVI